MLLLKCKLLLKIPTLHYIKRNVDNDRVFVCYRYFKIVIILYGIVCNARTGTHARASLLGLHINTKSCRITPVSYNIDDFNSSRP